MTPEQIVRRLKDRFSDAVIEAVVEGKHPHVVVGPQQWRPIAQYLRDDPDLAFDALRCLSGVDYPPDHLVGVYDLISFQHRHTFAIKVRVDRESPNTPSISDVWPAAEWHEREAYDLFGIIYDDHPDFRRILLPDDWAGYPLRKDYNFPREYHGIPGSTELGMAEFVPAGGRGKPVTPADGLGDEDQALPGKEPKADESTD